MNQLNWLIRLGCCLLLSCFFGWSAEVSAQGIIAAPAKSSTTDLSPAQVFDLADTARLSGDLELAEEAYRALATNPNIAIRNEARFRLALMMAETQQRYREAAVLLRTILDEQPDIARVRLELARIQALLGNFSEARRELRAAEAVGIPPEVERLVRFFTSTLANQKRAGFNIDVAFAPDSNINRATRSDTLETIVGDFDLSEDARARSGLGLSLQTRGFVRATLNSGTNWLAQIGASGRFFQESAFNDHSLVTQTGPQFTSGSDRISVLAILSQRWFGGKHYASSYGLMGEYRHPLSKQTELRVDGSGTRIDDQLNDIRSVNRYSLGVGVDTALDPRTGGGGRILATREVAEDPAYSAASIGSEAYIFRELASTTAVLRAGFSHRENDERLFLYPKRRIDERLELSMAGTFRSLRVGSFAPLARIRFERNWSTVDIYDYKKFSAELGITAAF